MTSTSTTIDQLHSDKKASPADRLRQASRVVLISAAVSIPCWWHHWVEAGDLASHTYNAWLTQLTRAGRLPDFYLARQTSNVLFDWLLETLTNGFGFSVGEKVAATIVALTFFWGAVALVYAVSRRVPWHLMPLIFMLTYGWNFNMGFMNFCLSVGIASWGLALWWLGKGRRRWLLPFLVILAWLAHPIGALWLLCAVGYSELARIVPTRWHVALLLATAVAVLGVREYLLLHYRLNPQQRPMYLLTGTYQLLLYNRHYSAVAVAVAVIVIAAIAFEVSRRVRHHLSWSELVVPLELYAILVFAIALLPDGGYFPQYTGPVNFLGTRMVAICVLLLICALGAVARRGHLAIGFGLCAVVFFALLYWDTGKLASMENQATRLVGGIPRDSRVIQLIAWPDSHVLLPQFADRACIGRCYGFGNYEPSSGQFRLRARGPNPYVAATPDEVGLIQDGMYVLKPGDPPLFQLYQCGSAERLCLDQLQPGVPSGAMLLEKGWLPGAWKNRN